MDTEIQKQNTTETSKQREIFCLTCILKIAAAASVEITKATQKAYLDVLIGLPPESLGEASSRTIREWDRPHMMPPVKFILDRAHGNAQMHAEAAWETVQRFVFKVWHPDVGWPGGQKPDIDPATEYAIRQVGGMRKIHDVELNAVQFVRRDFLEAFGRYTAEDGAQVRLSETQAAGILGQLEAGLAERKAKQLPDGVALKREERAGEFTHIAAKTPEKTKREAPQQTREEYDRRMALLHRQAAQLCGEDS